MSESFRCSAEREKQWVCFGGEQNSQRTKDQCVFLCLFSCFSWGYARVSKCFSEGFAMQGFLMVF